MKAFVSFTLLAIGIILICQSFRIGKEANKYIEKGQSLLGRAEQLVERGY